MVKPESMSNFTKDVLETFAFLLGDAISESDLTPKDTTRMAKSFSSTSGVESYKFSKTETGYNITYITPFYTKYVLEGTKNKNGSVKMRARPFVNQIVHKDAEKLLKQAFRIVNARYRNR